MEKSDGPVPARMETVGKVVAVLEKAGIEFLNSESPGLRLLAAELVSGGPELGFKAQIGAVGGLRRDLTLFGHNRKGVRCSLLPKCRKAETELVGEALFERVTSLSWAACLARGPCRDRSVSDSAIYFAGGLSGHLNLGIMANSFRWSALDHQTIERKLATLKREITKEIMSGDRLTPIGESGNIGVFRAPRLFHSFEVIQEELANEWVERAYKVYVDHWLGQGGEKTPDFIRAVWMNALYLFVSDEVLPFLRLAFGVDERAMKLLDRTFASLPQGREASRRVHSVNRIYSAIRERWGSRTIPHEANIAELAITRRMSYPRSLDVPPVEPVPPPVRPRESRSTYQRIKEKSLREKLNQDPENGALRQELLQELEKQERLARELFELQGPELAISVFGRTDLDIAEEIKALRISIIFSIDEIEEPMEKTAEPTAIFSHSEEYESITFRGERYTLQPRQAAVVRLLHEALKKGHPAVPGRKILALPGCEQVSSVRDIFKSRSHLWNTLVVNCEETQDGRGFYRLHPDITG